MKNSVYFILIFQLLICVMSCSKDQNDPKIELNIESDKISCETCDDFGIVFDMNKNQVFIGGSKRVWIFDFGPQGNKLTQEINLSNEGELTSITARDGVLYLGINDPDGTGSVHQYSKSNSEWQYDTRYAIGRG